MDEDSDDINREISTAVRVIKKSQTKYDSVFDCESEYFTNHTADASHTGTEGQVIKFFTNIFMSSVQFIQPQICQTIKNFISFIALFAFVKWTKLYDIYSVICSIASKIMSNGKNCKLFKKKNKIFKLNDFIYWTRGQAKNCFSQVYFTKICSG